MVINLGVKGLNIIDILCLPIFFGIFFQHCEK